MLRQGIIFTIAIVSLSALQPSLAQDIIVLNTTGQPPLNTPEQTGFLDLVAQEAFARINVTLKTVQLPAERGLKNADMGIEDGEMSRIAGLQNTYTNLILVPEKIMDWEFVAYSAKSINLNNGWASLEGYAVSFINGWKIVERNIPSQADITKVQNPRQLFTLLKKHRSDVAVYERWSGLQLLRSLNMSKVSIKEPPLAVKEMYIYLHKKHSHLIPKLATALKQMKSDGRYQEIESKVLLPLENK